MQIPHVSIDVLVIRDNKILLGLMTEQWNYAGKQVYGVPGRDIHFNEKIGETLNRNIKEEFNCKVNKYEIIGVNANYALENHYIGIAIVAQIDGEPKVLLPDDWVKWEWFEKDAIPDNLFPATKNLIDTYLQNKVTVSE